MTLSVHATRRPLAHGGPPELSVDVDTAEPARAELDGTRFDFDGSTLALDGPLRDVLVNANGRPVVRVRADRASVDLSAAIEFRTLGRRLAGGVAGLTEAARIDATVGLRHRYEIEPNPPAAGDPAQLRVHTGDHDVVAVCVRIHEPTRGELPATRAHDGSWVATLPPRDDGTVVRYEVAATLADGTTSLVDDAGADLAWPRPDITFLRTPAARFSYAVGEPTVPDWLRDAVIYHALVDRFAADGGQEIDEANTATLLGFAGGTIAGLTARLDHVVDLGATAILVSPLTPGDMHVCYDVQDHIAVEPRLGTEADVRAMLDSAHARGIRVVLDTEMSYVGMRHPKAGTDWTLRAPDGRALGWLAGNPTFQPVDHFHPDARAHLLEAARWWLELGFDGFRLDSAHAAPFDFWTDFGAMVRTVNPDAVTIAESTREPEFCRRYRGRLTGFLDFDTQKALRGFAGDGSQTASDLAAAVELQAGLPSGLASIAFFECHDGDRFAFLAEGDRRRVELATALLLTLPGVPLLYYGTEVGMTQTEPGDMDLVARKPMRWSHQDRDMFDTTSDLVALRGRSHALRRGAYQTLIADDGAGIYAFERRDDQSNQRVVVIANVRDHPQRVDLPGMKSTEVDPLSTLIMEHA